VRPSTWLVLFTALGCQSERAREVTPPDLHGGMSVEQAIAARRTRREFAPTPLPRVELLQLAWAAQGVTEPRTGLRAAPSAGAIHPLELYFVTAAGVLHYRPATNDFEPRGAQDLRGPLAEAALGQSAVRLAPCVIVIAAVTERTRQKYGARATRYVAIEAGHVGQNLLLEATSRGLVGGPIGSFDDARVSAVLGLAPGEDPLYLITVGYPTGSAARAPK